MKSSPALAGIEVRHEPKCELAGERGASKRTDCRCRKGYRGAVWRAGRSKKGPWTGALAAARAWRVDELRRASRERERGGDPVTVAEAVEIFLAAAERGHVRNRSGDAFKAGVVAEYRRHARTRIVPRWGPVLLRELERGQLQAWVGELLAEGLSPSTVRNVVMPLRTLYREADTLGLGPVAEDPCRGLRLPASRGRRERIVDPSGAEVLLRALEPRDRALWATAFYLGLRAGELAALRAEDVDLVAGLVRVHPERGSWSWKVHEFGPPKSKAGARSLPVPARLRPFLAALDGAPGLVFGRGPDQPFSYWGTLSRAARTWDRAGLERVTFHEARHTYASYLIASGLNAKAVTTLLGHSSVAITFDRYGHLFPGHEDEARDLLDAFLG